MWRDPEGNDFSKLDSRIETVALSLEAIPALQVNVSRKHQCHLHSVLSYPKPLESNFWSAFLVTLSQQAPLLNDCTLTHLTAG